MVFIVEHEDTVSSEEESEGQRQVKGEQVALYIKKKSLWVTYESMGS